MHIAICCQKSLHCRHDCVEPQAHVRLQIARLPPLLTMCRLPLLTLASRHRLEHLLAFSGYLPAIVEGEDEKERERSDEKIEVRRNLCFLQVLVREPFYLARNLYY